MTVEMRPEIIGLGKSKGSRVITNFDVAQMMNDGREDDQREIPARVVDRLAKKVGLDQRGWLNEDEGASHLGTIAARHAMEMAGITIGDVKSIIVATGLPDYLGVPTGTIIVENLGGNKKIQTADISGACPGFFHALKSVTESLSSPYGIGGPQVCVAAEPASKGINPRVPETYMLFGDGGGAFVMDLVDVKSSSPRFTFDFGNDPSLREDLYVPAGGSRNKVDEEALIQGLNCIKMNGAKVKEAAIRYMTEIAESVLSKAGMTLADIDLVVPHQANLEIINGVAKNLQVPDEKLYVNIHRYGNTSAASVPIAIREAWEEGRLKKGDKILAVTFGAGLNFAGAIIPMNSLPEATQAI
ncbi:MAG: ketoacyl-ACP synthase III [Patescibacteria group bacterium]